jgi:glycosyltransferase involved in cell wall biosynthesis
MEINEQAAAKNCICYSVIIPAFNEEEYLERTLTTIHEAMASLPLAGELIVVDNNSTDRTSQVAKEAGARVVFEPKNQISRARNTGARAALGDYLVFVDADTTISPALLAESLRLLRSGDFCGGGSVMVFDHSLPWYYASLLSLWTFISTKFGYAAGSYLFCLRKAFLEVGGFSERVYASEEIWFSRDLKAWGSRNGLGFFVISDLSALTSARKFRWFSPARVLGTSFLLLLFPFGVRFKRLSSYWYERPKGRE